MRPKRYLGTTRTGERRVFLSATTPTEATHGEEFISVLGPFRTLRAAMLTAMTHPNPHIQHVQDAERIAARLAREARENGGPQCKRS
jgi:hypothetical protein